MPVGRGSGVIVGRSDERAALWALLDGAAAGRAGSLLVVGEAGIGKTVLLGAAAEEAARRGFVLVVAPGVPGEKDVPGAALSLLGARLEKAGVPSDVVDQVRSASGQASAASSLLHAVAVAAEARPLLLVADDVHWWDELSLAALLFAVRRFAVDQVAVLVAGRPQVLDNRGLAALPHLEVGPLPRGLAGALARSVAPDTAEAVARRLWSALGGNTLAVVETAARLSDDERVGRVQSRDELPVGPGVVERWAGQVDALPARSQLALAVLAVVTTDEALMDALSAAGVLVDDLLPAEADGLVVVTELRWRFRHPLVRHAVVAAEPPATMRLAHAAAARALVGASTSPQQVLRRVRHRASAALAPDRDLASEIRADARLLEDMGARQAAAHAFELAAAADPDVASAAGCLARASSLALDDFDDDDAIRLGRAGLALEPPPPVRGSLLRVTGVAVARVEDVVEGSRLLTESLGLLAGEERRDAVRDLLFSLDLASERGARAPALVAQLGPVSHLTPLDRLLVAHTDAHVHPGIDARHELLAGLVGITDDEAVASGRAVETVANAAFDVGLEASGPMLHRIVARLSASEDPRRRLDGLGIDLLLSFWEGRWDDLTDTVEETRELSDALGRIDLYSDALLMQVMSRRARPDEFAECHHRAREIMTNAGMDFWLRTFPGERALLALALGRGDEAVDPLVDELTVMGERIGAHTVSADHVLALVECLADAGRRDEASDAGSRLRELIGPAPCALGEGFLARAEAVVSPDDRVHELLCRAEERIETGVHVFELAMTRLRHARWLRRHRRRREAADRLALALDVFDRLGCTTWADECRSELRAVGVDVVRHDRYDARALLTAQERRVADAVAAGSTNDEVGRRLFLSPRTVEVHLTHVYRKLGIRSRTELAALSAADGSSVRHVPSSGTVRPPRG